MNIRQNSLNTSKTINLFFFFVYFTQLSRLCFDLLSICLCVCVFQMATATTTDEDDCYFCLKPLDEGLVVEAHPCMHTIHKSCFELISKERKSIDCPRCTVTIKAVITKDSGWGIIPPSESDPAFTSLNGILYDWAWGDIKPNDKTHWVYPIKSTSYEDDTDSKHVEKWLSTHKSSDCKMDVLYPGTKHPIRIPVCTEWTAAELKDYISVRCGISSEQLAITKASQSLLLITLKLFS